MSGKMRWRYGNTNPVTAAVDAETEIDMGDLVFQGEGGHTEPASDVAAVAPFSRDGEDWTRCLQRTFAAQFLGVAMQRSRKGNSAPIQVATTGVFEFDCPSSTFDVDDFVGPDEDTAGDALWNQQVARVLDPKYAIGRVAKRVNPAATRVVVEIRSTVFPTPERSKG